MATFGPAMKGLLPIILLALVSPLAKAEMREWKTADESKTLVAEYVSSRDGKVTIRRKRDRRTFTIDLTALSQKDQDYVRQREESPPGDDALEAGDADGEFAKLITGDWERAEGHGLKYRIFGARKLRRGKGPGYPLVVYLHGRGGDVMTPEEPWGARAFTTPR